MDTRYRVRIVTLFLLLAVGLLALLPSVPRALAQPRGGQHLYIPLVPGGGPPATTTTGSQRVYGLLGQLSAQRSARASYLLTTPTGDVYALVGRTPEMEQRMSVLARATPSPQVKVWGEIQAGGTLPLIVVNGLLQAGTPAPGAVSTPTATPSPVATGGSGVGGASIPVAIVRFDLVNLHNEPSASSSRVGYVVRNQSCNIVGRNPAYTWWLLECAGGLTGWIDVRLVFVQGSTTGVPIVTSAAVPVTATPQPTATPSLQTFSGWRAAMYSNPYLSGDPVVVADVPQINFDWGHGAPASSMPADNFSLRLERRMTFAPGYYRFTVQADDGVRVWVDGELLVDEWHGSANQTFRVGRMLSGAHLLRVEYLEVSGLAYLRMQIEASDPTTEWDASYYAGITPTGTPQVRRREPRSVNPLDYYWGTGSPAASLIGVDSWSARWTGQFFFEGGNYLFRVRADDGVRVWLDDLLVIDQWRDGYKEAENRFIGVGRGSHTVTVAYYERSGSAQVAVWWIRESAYLPPD